MKNIMNLDKTKLETYIRSGGNKSLAGRMLNYSEGHARKMFAGLTIDIAKELLESHSPKGSEIIVPLTDWHIGEVIKPDILNGYNEYNLSTAKDRMTVLFSELENYYHDGVEKVHFVMMGDHVSGQLHMENLTDDEMSAIDANNEFSKLVIKHVSEFKETKPELSVIFSGVTSNHARLTHKQRYKNALSYSMDKQLQNNLEFAFEQDDSVTILPFDDDILLRVAGTNWAVSHGHLGRGGTVAGAVRGMGVQSLQAIEKIWSDQDCQVDYAMIGHFHCFSQIENWFILPCACGANEYQTKKLRIKVRPPRSIFFECADGELIDQHLFNLN